MRGKWDENNKSGKRGWGRVFVVAPFSAHPSRSPIIRLARTRKGTLATQAIISAEQAGQILVDEYFSVF